MRITGMGVSLSPNDSVNNLERLRDKLSKVCELGFEVVEIPIQAMDVIINGEIKEQRLKAYVELLERFPLKYCTHAPFDLNLFRLDHLEIEQKLLMSSVEVSSAIGADLMVYHTARFVGEEQFLHPQSWSVFSEDDKNNWMRMERDWLRRAGRLGEQLHVKIGMENMRPYLDCPDYCYSVIPSELAKQVELINQPNVGITLDVGHMYLAQKFYGIDFLQEMETIIPHIIHLHVHDNYGKPCYSTEKNQYNLLPLGRGDMHMPIGDGFVPMKEISVLLQEHFEGYYIHEVREKYESEWCSLLDRAKCSLPKTVHSCKQK